MGPARGYDEAPVSLFEGAIGQRLDAKTRAVGGHLDFARLKPEVVAQRLWNNQSTCLINGCTHA
ncbi:hypothetical protein A9X00_20105 [Mycobacterium sp. 1245805.9]|nr:hypothetical protein A9X00_20105 [Mycobacterium sp. 1245805.9]